MASSPNLPLVLGRSRNLPDADEPDSRSDRRADGRVRFRGRSAARARAPAVLHGELGAASPARKVRRSTLAVPVAVESWSAYTSASALSRARASFLTRLPRSSTMVAGALTSSGSSINIFYRTGTPDDTKNRQGIGRASFATLKAEGGREVWIAARNEGAWGNNLSAKLSFTTSTLALAPTDFFSNRLRLPAGLKIYPGATLRLSLGGGVRSDSPGRNGRRRLESDDGSRQRWAWFDLAIGTPVESAELVEGRLDIDDGVNPTETHDHLGLAANHPRWIAAALVNESDLVLPCDDPNRASGDPLAYWLDCDLEVDPALPSYVTALFVGGADRYPDITPEDFFDDDWAPGDDCPGSGIHAVTDLDDLSMLTAPDLYSPGPLAPIELVTGPISFAGPEFAECIAPIPAPPQGPPAQDLTGLRLDPNEDLDTIAALQRRMIELADQLESFIVLLDVPPGLSQRRILYWRAKFDSAYAAAYHPWLNVARTDDRRDGLVGVNPSAVAAGIIALRESRFGVPYGPANEIAAGVVDATDRVSPSRHDELHQNAINVYLPERDGIRLTAARTLALDQTWRQLNVRRLMTMIRRALYRQMQWAVFEPNNQKLRFQISRMLESYLRQLYRANAFTGATESQAFFVKCDDKLNPLAVQQQGQAIAQIGIAPAEPLEFIVLNVARDGDFSLTVEEG